MRLHDTVGTSTLSVAGSKRAVVFPISGTACLVFVRSDGGVLCVRSHVDVLITETDSQAFRQPAWTRYAAGFAGDKPVVAVENPYGGVVPELAQRMKEGKGYDQFRMMQYEAAALGINMSIPYGAWLGSVIEDSFNPPHELCAEISRFLMENEGLYTTRTYSETAPIYSVESTFEAECRHLTEHQRCLLVSYLERGGRLVVVGALGLNLPEEDVRPLLEHHRTVRRRSENEFELADMADGPQVVLDTPVDMAVNIHEVGREAALHFIRYDFDPEQDAVPLLPTLVLDVRLSRPFRQAVALSPDEELNVTLEERGLVHRLHLQNVPLYGAILLQG